MPTGLSSAFRKVGLRPTCHRFPTWLVAQPCARDSAVPYLQGYSEDECTEDRTSQILLLALDMVIAEQMCVGEQEWRQKFVLCSAEPASFKGPAPGKPYCRYSATKKVRLGHGRASASGKHHFCLVQTTARSLPAVQYLCVFLNLMCWPDCLQGRTEIHKGNLVWFPNPPPKKTNPKKTNHPKNLPSVKHLNPVLGLI